MPERQDYGDQHRANLRIIAERYKISLSQLQVFLDGGPKPGTTILNAEGKPVDLGLDQAPAGLSRPELAEWIVARIESESADERLTNDLRTLRDTAQLELEKLATAIDFNELQTRGILKKRARGGWLLLTSMDNLPEHARAQVTQSAVEHLNGRAIPVVYFRRQSSRRRRS